ncbi:MAG: hypothetical protein A2114_00025 [Candidatus Vogelbacteria bacterium GWA1_51_14]|uniref:TGS domain-containing protein n=1 Tax=Candidatus Vogelbacteria bacterium GWA1_51_14 TaxID=1802435 RepID=A0A1G2Q9E7_9BACT|nr:MAG: hypothetical protein A2114_00025 [Candidatus Vogelbacteria bacterium GWA1_51_14]
MPDIKEVTSLMTKAALGDKQLVERAFHFAEAAHREAKRYSGEQFIIHPFETAKILAEMRADAETIAAGLLHDTVEDGVTTNQEIEREFGQTIAFLVEGVTKLGKLRYQGAERHAESLRKLFIAMAEDLRVIIIRLADRLHNVRTLEHIPRDDKRQRIALETLEIYAPLANRLGIWKIKGQLEDAAFPHAYPADYAQMLKLRKTKGKENIKRLEKLSRAIVKEAAKHNITNIQVDYRIKYLYSTWLKLKKHDMDIDQIYDLSALRIIVPTVGECYQILGLVHTLWRPIAGRIKDYIAQPKPNGYQSIHTAVTTGESGIAEIQIRTAAMQFEAEYGLASHIIYDESGKSKDGGEWKKKTRWIKELIEWQKTVEGSEEFLTHLKTNLFKDRIFVFTPKGDVIELPEGATPIDFAYAIHSEIGEHVAGATVNGKFISLNTPLHNHDVVAVEVKKTAHPTVKWLTQVTTSMAKKHIKNFLGREREEKKSSAKKIKG